MSVSLSVRLPDEVMRKLEELSTLIDRPKTYIVRKALESYLEEYTDYLIALDRLMDKEDEIISSRELRERIGL